MMLVERGEFRAQAFKRARPSREGTGASKGRVAIVALPPLQAAHGGTLKTNGIPEM
jgi:hypothetical protein